MGRFLSFFVSPHDAESLSVLVGNRFPRYALSLFARIAETLEQIFGVRLGIVVPPHFDRNAHDQWRFGERFKTLKASGIATSFRFQKYENPDEPRGFITHIDISGSNSKNRIGYSGTGLDVLDRNKTFLPALGEAVERWALSNFTPEPKVLTRSSQSALGGTALDLATLAGFSEEQRRNGHPRYTLPFRNDTQFIWMRGFSLTQKKPLWLPLQLVSLKYAHELPAHRKEPLLAPIISTGAAAGPDLASAILNGVLEVIERDAFMIYWLNSLAPEQVDIATIPDERFKKMSLLAERYNLEAYLMDLRTDVPAHTLCTVLLDRTRIGPSVVLGTATDLDFIAAAYKSFSQTLTARAARRKLYDTYRDIVPKETKDLRYRSRLVFWSLPEQLEHFAFFLKGDTKAYAEIARRHPFQSLGGAQTNLERLLHFFQTEKYETAYAEILPKEIKKKVGMPVVFVKIPAFQPVYLDESLPAFSGGRLREVPRKIGKKPAERGNTFPHPFP